MRLGYVLVLRNCLDGVQRKRKKGEDGESLKHKSGDGQEVRKKKKKKKHDQEQAV